MKFLTLEQLLQFHALVLLKDGGADGVRDLGRLEAVVATQYQMVFGSELYDDIYAKAAAIIRGIIADHPFVDGNKRTAMLAGMVLMNVNGLELTAQAGEIEDFAIHIVKSHCEVQQISEWLKSRTLAADK